MSFLAYWAYLALANSILAGIGFVGRKVTKLPFFSRLVSANVAMLKAHDILLCTLWLAPLYVVGLADRPSGRQMVSSYIGKAAHNGHHWAKRAETVIDWVFETFFNDRPRHCYRAFRHYQGIDQ